jgi:hypothetical protein
MFQLEIFWRRALFANNNNKVHCLVNADLLDYDVSDKGEKSLERHMKSAEAKGIILSIVEFFTGFDTRVTQHVPLVEQEVLVYPSGAS